MTFDELVKQLEPSMAVPMYPKALLIDFMRKAYDAGAEHYEKQKEINKELVDEMAELRKENESLKKSFVLKDIARICEEKDEAQKTALYNLDGWRKSDAKLGKAKGYVRKLVETALKGGGVLTKEELEEMREFINDGGKK